MKCLKVRKWTRTRTYFPQQQALVLLSDSIMVLNIDVVMINVYHHLMGEWGRPFQSSMIASTLRDCHGADEWPAPFRLQSLQ